MNKIFMLLAAGVAMMFVSCSDDDGGSGTSPDGKKLVSKIRIVEADNELSEIDMTFKYNNDGVIEKIIENGRSVGNSYDEEWTGIYTFSRSGKKLTSTCDFTFKDNNEGTTKSDIAKTVYNLNDKGFISQYEWATEEKDERSLYTFSYNSEGQLIGSTEEEHYDGSIHESAYEYGWSNGNLVSEKKIGNSYVSNYVYTKEENKSNIDFSMLELGIETDDYLELFGYLGKANKNLISEVGNGGSTTYRYTFNSDYCVTKIQEYSSNTLQRTYTIEYK